MRTSNILLIAGGIGAWLWYKSVRKGIDMLEASLDPSSIRVKMDFLTPVITYNINIYNPNKTGVPVREILADVFFRGQKIGSMKNLENITLGGSEARTVPVRARVNLFNLAASLLNKDVSRDIAVTGLLKTGIIDVPFNYNYKL